MKTSTKALLTITLLSATWLTYWKFFIRDKDPYVQYLKVQKHCDKWKKEIKASDQPMVFYIHRGEATLTFPKRRISGALFTVKSDGYEIIDDKCMPTRIYYTLPMRDLGVENHKNLPMTWDKVYVSIDALQHSRQKHMDLMEDTIKPMRDERKYQPQIAMKHFPLWFYPNYFGENDYGYGLQSYDNPLTDKPYVLTCNFILPTKVNEENENSRNILNDMTHATQAEHDNIFPCRGFLHIITLQSAFNVEVWLQQDTLPYINEIYPKIEEQLTSFLSTPTN